MSFASALAQVDADNRYQARVATFGHLAPHKDVAYEGYIVFAIPEYDSGNACIVSSEFKNLPDSPWLYDAMVEFAEKRRAGVYRFEGVCRNYKFKGKVTRIDTAN